MARPSSIFRLPILKSSILEQSGPSYHCVRLVHLPPPPIFCSSSRRSFSSSPLPYSGHSRWSKIRHKKGAVDAQRGTFFSRLIGDIHNALRPPNSHDPNLNARLAVALNKAKEAGVPKANIEAAFARARSAIDGSGQSVVYEAVGAGGKVAFMVECLTENPSRTVQRVKEILHKNNARLSPVSFLFERKGLITIDPTSSTHTVKHNFDALFDAAVEAGAEDVRDLTTSENSTTSSSPEDETHTESTGLWEVITLPTDLFAVSNHLTNAGYELASSDIGYTPLDPLTIVPTPDEGVENEVAAGEISEDKAEAVMRTVAMLEDDTDVVKVWTNISDD